MWTEDEGGPYQAIPQAGPSWQPEGEPARQPHEYIRGGTAKLLTLFRPATGELRAKAVATAPNAVLHPWLQGEVTEILAELPPPPPTARAGCDWADWGWTAERLGLSEPLPPIRLILIMDNLTGHHTPTLVRWLAEHGVVVLYTPLGGSWLNMAESIQRIIKRRALDGQHPRDQATLMAWLEATVRGWNADPTPFTWGGKRHARRDRAYARRHRVGGSGATTSRPLPRRSRTVRQYHHRATNLSANAEKLGK